jgi:alpha-L-fucosidase 2
MRTQGAFLISAVRKGGVTQFIELTSLAGAPCRIWTDMPNPTNSSNVSVKSVGDGVFDLDLAKGQSVILVSAGTSPDLTIQPVDAKAGQSNFWGLH